MACTNSLRIFFPAIAIALASTFAYGQSAPSNPAMTYGMVPTVGQWNNWFQQKQNTLGFTPVNRAGDTMLGKLKTAAPTTTGAGLALLPGVAPLSPVDGDLWTTNTGLYVQIGGSTIGPIRNGNVAGPSTSVVGNIATFGNVSGSSIVDSGKSLPSGVIVGTTDIQTLTNKTLTSPTLTNPIITGTLNGGIPSISLANQSALQAFSISGLASGYTVARQGYYSNGDGGQAIYSLSTSACSLNSGAGDNGTQVKPTVGTGCWILNTPAGGIDIRVWGAVGDGSTSNGAVFTNIFSNTSPISVVLPARTFRIPCGTYYSAHGPIRMSGQRDSIVQLPSGCAFSGGTTLFRSDGINGMSYSGFTVDLNTPTTPSQVLSIIGGYAFAGNADKFDVTGMRIINGTSPIFLVSAAATSGFSFTNINISGNYLTLSAADPAQNQCILLTTVGASGNLPAARVTNNICMNSAIQADGANPLVSGNDVSGWRFGNGIFVAYNSGSSTPSATNCVISNNKLHDAPSGVDVNNVTTSGIENNCVNALIAGNAAWNLGGAGYVNFGDYATYVGNSAYNIGSNGTGASGGAANEACFAAGTGSLSYGTSNYLTLIGNQCAKTSGSTTQYSFAQYTGYTGITTLRSNSFVGNGVPQALLLQSGATTSSDIVFSSTVTALSSPVAAISFTGLDTASFKQWKMICRNVTPTSAVAVGLQVGEGSNPTWETGANYGYSQSDTAGGTVAGANTGTATMLNIGLNAYDQTQSAGAVMTITAGDLAYAVGQKMFNFTAGYFKTASGVASATGAGYWNGDTNSITALRLIPASGNIYGSCTLEGRP